MGDGAGIKRVEKKKQIHFTDRITSGMMKYRVVVSLQKIPAK